MDNKEPLVESVRAKVAAVMAGLLVIFNLVTGAVPSLAVVTLTPDLVSAITQGVTWLTVAFILGRSLRNSAVK